MPNQLLGGFGGDPAHARRIEIDHPAGLMHTNRVRAVIYQDPEPHTIRIKGHRFHGRAAVCHGPPRRSLRRRIQIPPDNDTLATGTFPVDGQQAAHVYRR
ncbi:hypothetical protein MAUB_58670 [Mycolicibacterium aubagnense]|uniref:Uncharacterized protein n=1 Tax=Mycolicibacterium aubagnense TaxID=319707 RepID=A0ABN5Z4L2_9MYCO|nr:hypothetical protein MAUB_58670 [Mycolicibacterium aubagnense]